MKKNAMRRFTAAFMCASAIALGAARGYAQPPAGDAERQASLAHQTVSAVGEAATEMGTNLRTGGQSAVDQGRKLWHSAVTAAVQRTASSFPMLLKGLLLLGAFWLAGALIGGGVRRLLDLTQMDERAIRDWGLEGLLKRPDGTSRSLSGLLGCTIKWILILFGFVAFFNSINLTLVAAPLQQVLDKIIGTIPQLLKATVILLVYWAIATVVRMALTRILKATKLDERACRKAQAETTDEDSTKAPPSTMLGRLAFYVILLFGLPPFLQALGQDALVAPLQDMLSKALAFLPNLIAAGIILLVGRIVASIVREFVSNLLAATGLDERVKSFEFGKALGSNTPSSIAAQIVYFFILIPIIVAAVDSLGLKVIADPIKATLQSILDAVPALLVAVVVTLIGCLVAKVVRKLVTSLLAGVGVDTLPSRIGLEFLTPKAGQMPLSGFLGAIVYIIILLITAQQAAAALRFEQLADLVRQVITYLPNLVVGLVIMLATLSLSKFVGKLVNDALAGQGHAKVLTVTARCAIILLGMGMALEQLGIGQDIVSIAVGAVLGGTALALGLAFGLGGKERAKELLDRLVK